MQSRRWIGTLGAALLSVIIITMLAGSAGAAKYKAIYKFKVQNDGRTPMASLVFDAEGNLYGTTANGGPNRTGNIFELSPNPDGTWTERVIYNFTGNKYGAHPSAALIVDTDDNLYGTTLDGGKYRRGTVFELAPNPDGTWTESLLHSFRGNDRDGGDPSSRLMRDAAGSLYGTTPAGGAYAAGTAYQLTRNPDGTWTERIIHDFACDDGCVPRAGLTADSAGNLYGTASSGATDNFGTVFSLMPNDNGTWTHSVLYRFTGGSDGANPVSSLIFDGEGNFYGTTINGGNHTKCLQGCGAAFRLKPTPGGWEERVIHAFGGRPAELVNGDLVFDFSGNLYGAATVTFHHGSYCCGMIYRLAPQGDGNWKIATAHRFKGTDGAYPRTGLVLDTAGRLYGTTPYGGHGYRRDRKISGAGVVFEIMPK